jgi:diguanylate cyclase (GGDEF)-like protein/excisionase family DNA binding protein
MPPESAGAGAVRDELTTLILPQVFRLALEMELARASRHGHGLSVLLLGLDNVREVTGAHGTATGDRLVERVGLFARRFFRRHDWVARHDPESLAVLLPGATMDIAATLAGRFRETITQRLVLRDFKTGSETRVSLSAAVAAADLVQGDLEAADVISELEAALGRARLHGGNDIEQVGLLPTSMTIPGAAVLLGRSRDEIADLIREGTLRATRRGRQFYIERQLLVALSQNPGHANRESQRPD